MPQCFKRGAQNIHRPFHHAFGADPDSGDGTPLSLIRGVKNASPPPSSTMAPALDWSWSIFVLMFSFFTILALHQWFAFPGLQPAMTTFWPGRNACDWRTLSPVPPLATTWSRTAASTTTSSMGGRRMAKASTSVPQANRCLQPQPYAGGSSISTCSSVVVWKVRFRPDIDLKLNLYHGMCFLQWVNVQFWTAQSPRFRRWLFLVMAAVDGRRWRQVWLQLREQQHHWTERQRVCWHQRRLHRQRNRV